MTPCIWIYEILGWNCGRDRFEIDLNKYGLHPGLHVGNLLLSFSPRLSMYSKPIDKTGQSKVQKNIETAWNCYLPGKVISNKIMEADEYYIYICVCVYVCPCVYIYIHIAFTCFGVVRQGGASERHGFRRTSHRLRLEVNGAVLQARSRRHALARGSKRSLKQNDILR